MTKLSDSGCSLRPDGQLRSTSGLQLLFEWEVSSAGVPMQEAVEDLKSESSNPNAGGSCFAMQGQAAASQPCRWHADMHVHCRVIVASSHLSGFCACSQDGAMVPIVL